MKIVVAGTGYVGLVTGVTMAEIGHTVTCVDVDENNIKKMQGGICPIYEPGLEKLMHKNKNRLFYTTDYKSAYKNASVIFIGVGTPEKEDGSANLDYVFQVVEQIVETIVNDCVIVIKSTVPIGTNDKIEQLIKEKVKSKLNIYVVSNPEFLSQGTAVNDTLYASRIIVGTEDDNAANIMYRVYEPLIHEPYNVPYLRMSRRSAEMVKYASNVFLALKISYINEISNFCEKIDANIDDVVRGMGYDNRIGNQFLKSGIGYGGSCFPKDTKALYHLSKEHNCELKMIKTCIDVNQKQKVILFNKFKSDFCDNIVGKNVAVLGVTFKPGTDDLREAPSIDNINLLLEAGCNVSVYDPVGLNNCINIFKNRVNYCSTIDECISNKDVTFIMTEWPEIISYDLNKFKTFMKTPVIYDGRNCYSLDKVKAVGIKYISIGRETILNH